jgi:hypothetical protein
LTTPADVTAQRPIARVGYHSDCFLGHNNDQGTYENEQLTDLLKDLEHVPMGGETCGTIQAPRGECANAKRDLATFRFGSLNRDWGEIVNDWAATGCLDAIERQLGYRFELKSFTASTVVRRGTKLPFKLVVRNSGWARTMNHRQVILVLRHAVTKKVYRFQIGSTRPWAPGTDQPLDHAGISMPSTMPTGSYQMLLSLPDTASTLRQRPDYAIRLAHGDELWEEATGYNGPLRTVNVQA